MASVECVPFNIAEHYISPLLSLRCPLPHAITRTNTWKRVYMRARAQPNDRLPATLTRFVASFAVDARGGFLLRKLEFLHGRRLFLGSRGFLERVGWIALRYRVKLGGTSTCGVLFRPGFSYPRLVYRWGEGYLWRGRI